MRIRFWGIRGSCPRPLTNTELKKNKSFTYGGNTPCIEVLVGQNSLIFDGGTGLRVLGNSKVHSTNPPKEYHLFFSHFHWDHIQGVPFFKPLYDKNVKINFYSPNTKELRNALVFQQREPFFPVPFLETASEKVFVQLKSSIALMNDIKVDFLRIPHTSETFAYKVEHADKSFVYMTDFELFKKPEDRYLQTLVSFLKGADAVVMDSQYSFGETVQGKENWGHSSAAVDIDLCLRAGIKTLVLYHFDPDDSDEDIRKTEQYARQYYMRLTRTEKKNLHIVCAYEGLELKV